MIIEEIAVQYLITELKKMKVVITDLNNLIANNTICRKEKDYKLEVLKMNINKLEGVEKKFKELLEVIEK